MVKKLNLSKYIHWHATLTEEKENIIKLFGNTNSITMVKNFTADYSNATVNTSLTKAGGSLKLVIVSRIHPIKNLKFSLEVLKDMSQAIEFNIYGPIEDKEYWEECQALIEGLPLNLQVNYHGPVEHSKIADAFSSNHFFLLPTHGENFGHVISESLIAGTPVLISQHTPWRKLSDHQVGWDLPLDKEVFRKTINDCVDLNNEEYKKMAQPPHQYVKDLS